MIPKVINSPEAELDLLEIWLFIAEHDITAADRFLSNMEARTQVLLLHPEMGRQREELLPTLRSIPEGRYIVFYRIAGTNIEIVRVLHGSRDIENMFSDD